MSETSGHFDPSPFTLHHMGIAVPDLQPASEFYSKVMGLRLIAEPVEDPIQKVRVCFLADAGRAQPCIELICPLDDKSPVNGYLKKGIGAYHLCYEVNDIESELAALQTKGCLIVSQPVPAVAFAGRKIAWVFTPTKHLLELLEKRSA
ncbi:MAG TPA: VOC family protein [Verrucomicrobiae bacterium]|nr:VOC family protein [Verrucomicrobiae bacterium]